MRRAAMKNTRRIAAIILAAVMMTGSVFTVLAQDGSVVYKGNGSFEAGPGTEISDTSLFPDLEGAMPGDTLTQTVTVKNASSDSDSIKVYLRAEAHDEAGNPLATGVKETETEVTANDFLSQLSMTVMNGKTEIYKSSPDQTAGLTENVFLGELKEGETLSLEVTLAVPAELGNEYANRRGEVDWIFTVEEIEEEVPTPTPTETPTPEPTDKPKPTETPKPTATPKPTQAPKAPVAPPTNVNTGDGTPVLAWGMVFAAAFIAVVFLRANRKHKG